MLRTNLAIIGITTILSLTSLQAQANSGQQTTGEKIQEQAFTNDDVLALTKAGFGKDVVIGKVRSAGVAKFDLSTAALLILKSKGVADEVVAAMMARQDGDSRRAATPTPESPSTSAAEDDQGPIDRLKARIHRGNKDADAASKAANTRPCSAVRVEGSFFTGKTYKVQFDVADVSKAVAMTRATQYLVSNGWKLQTTDKDSGVITAAVDVIMGSGQSAPLSVVVNERGTAINVAISFATTGGTAASQSSVTKEFCALSDAIAAQR